jgi:hypothetical protein
VNLQNLHGVHHFPGNTQKQLKEGIMDTFRERQEFYKPAHMYMTPEYQPDLTFKMRAILFDWIMEVGQEYMLKRQTVHSALNHVDRFLSKVCVFFDTWSLCFAHPSAFRLEMSQKISFN